VHLWAGSRREVHFDRIRWRVSIHDRPLDVEPRTTFGHWVGKSSIRSQPKASLTNSISSPSNTVRQEHSGWTMGQIAFRKPPPASEVGYRGGLGVYLSRATLAKRVHRILQRQAPGRMSQGQPVLLSEPCQRHHRDLEGGLRHGQAAFIIGIFGPSGLRSKVHPLKPVTILKATGPKTGGRSWVLSPVGRS